MKLTLISAADFQSESNGSEIIFDKNKNKKYVEPSRGAVTAVLQTVSGDCRKYSCRSRYVLVVAT